MGIFSSRRRQEHHAVEAVLRRASKEMKPSATLKKNIHARIQSRIEAPLYLLNARESLMPDASAKARIWQYVSPVASGVPLSVWARMKTELMPTASDQQQLKARILEHITSRRRLAFARPFSWVAAFAVIAIVISSGPAYLLIPPTVADSRVTVSGDVSLLSGGLFQPKPANTPELALLKSALIQAGKQGGKLIAHDDYVLRMDANTSLALHDLANRPNAPTHSQTATLHTGKIWLQSFVPDQSAGITVAIGDERVVIHEGSVLISVNKIQVWNGRAIVQSQGQDIILLAGQEYVIRPDGTRIAHRMENEAYTDSWVTKNLANDAVHQRAISQMQQERRAAQAGILPGSPLYGAKRVLEAASLALTFNAESRTKVLLSQANTRLNEAAALIASADEGASVPLEEYKETILAAASGSHIAQSIIQRDLADTTAGIAAALPGDDAYRLKTAIFETTVAVLPSTEENVEDQLLADQVQAVKRTVQEGNIEEGRSVLASLEPRLSALNADSAVVQEAAASLSVSAVALSDERMSVSIAGVAIQEAGSTDSVKAPQYPAPQTILSEEDRMGLVGLILGRLDKVKNQVSKCNEMVLALRQINSYNSADQAFLTGRLLRDTSSDMAKTFRSIHERMSRGEKVDCKEEFSQPKKTVF